MHVASVASKINKFFFSSLDSKYQSVGGKDKAKKTQAKQEQSHLNRWDQPTSQDLRWELKSRMKRNTTWLQHLFPNKKKRYLEGAALIAARGESTP